MTGRVNEGPIQAYDGPPDYRKVGRHGVFPDLSHDEVERLNVLAQLNRHLSTRLIPGVKQAWETRALPAFEKANDRAPKDRHEVRKALLKDPAFQTWSALRRLTMEQRQQAGGCVRNGGGTREEENDSINNTTA